MALSDGRNGATPINPTANALKGDSALEDSKSGPIWLDGIRIRITLCRPEAHAPKAHKKPDPGAKSRSNCYDGTREQFLGLKK